MPAADPIGVVHAVQGALNRVALERARLVAPFVLLAIVIGLAMSEPSGIPLSTPIIAWNVVIITVMAALCSALWRRRIPARFAHVALLITWWAPISGGLIAQYITRSDQLVLTYIVEVAGAAFMMRTRDVLGSFLVFDAICVPLILRDTADRTAIYFSSLAAAQLFALLFQRMYNNALIRAETNASALAQELAERERLHEQLLHSQRMESIGTLAAGLAHDMNNILASISNMSELMRDEANELSRADLDDIRKQAARGAELTRGLLAFSRKGQYRKLVVDIDALLGDVAPLLSRTLPKAIEIKTESAAAGARVLGDPAHLQQVIINLGVNAADAMNGAGTLTIRAEQITLDGAQAAALQLPPSTYVLLRAADTGAGMDAATRKRAFEPFFTTKPLGKGTGLGLSTVWGIIQSHGGTIAIDSKPGAGTTFSIYLPITTEPISPPPKRASSPPLPRMTVLVVDDEAAVRASTIRLLQRQGLDAIGAANGAEALQLFDQHANAISLVILDMGMPVMGGAECFAELRKRSEVPVLIATGFAIDADAQAMIAQGASLIEKPYASKDLLDLVKIMLGFTKP